MRDCVQLIQYRSGFRNERSLLVRRLLTAHTNERHNVSKQNIQLMPSEFLVNEGHTRLAEYPVVKSNGIHSRSEQERLTLLMDLILLIVIFNNDLCIC